MQDNGMVVAIITVPTIVRLRPLILVNIGKHTLTILVDSRYDISFIDNKEVERKNLPHK